MEIKSGSRSHHYTHPCSYYHWETRIATPGETVSKSDTTAKSQVRNIEHQDVTHGEVLRNRSSKISTMHGYTDLVLFTH